MSTDPLPDGPDQDAMIALIRERWPHAVTAVIEGGIFFSLDDKHWPNFATIVWQDDFDEGAVSNLTARPGVYRVNVGVDPEAFTRLVGSLTDPDYAALDRFVPHPVYAKQRWISVLNPSDATVHDELLPLIGAAHDRLVAQRERVAANMHRTNA
jgi:hypothetical protein